MHTQRRAAGFTLLEISIVLVLIGVIVGSGLVVFTSSLQASQYNTTVARMDAIEKAILNFAIAYNRIPCPSDLTKISTSATYGYEAGASAGGVGTGECYTGMTPAANSKSTSGAEEGGVPTRALRLPDDYMYDGWGRRFRYAVDPAWTKTSALPVVSMSNPCAAATTSVSAIRVNDATGAARTTAGMYALISHGANGHGAYTSNGVTMNAGSVNANELVNCHCTSAGAASTYTPGYVEMAPSTDSTNALDNFDDIVTFKDPWQMQAQNYALTASTAQCVYITDCGGNRIQVFSTSGLTYLRQLGGCSSGACSSGSSAGQFNCPTGVTFDNSGNVWVSDSQNNRLEKFSNTGTYISTFTDSNLSQPVAMAFDGTGSYWVVNLTTNPGAGVKYNAAGAYVTGISGVGGGPPNLFEVTAVAIDSLNNVYFSGYNGGAIQEYNSSGSYLNTTTHINPVGLFIDPSGNVWTIPSCNSVGEYNSSLAATGTTFGSFTCAGAIAQDSSGNFWVMDGAANTMYEFTRSGASVTSFGSTGSGNGNFNNIGAPAGGIAIGGR